MKWPESLEFLQSLLVSCQLEALRFWLFNRRNVEREGKLDRKVVVFVYKSAVWKLYSSLLQRVFQQNRHEDVLDLTVVQFEPDSADYIRVSGNKICWEKTFFCFLIPLLFGLIKSVELTGNLPWETTKMKRFSGRLWTVLACKRMKPQEDFSEKRSGYIFFLAEKLFIAWNLLEVTLKFWK